MRKALLFLHTFLLLIVTSSFVHAADGLDSKIEAEFCLMLEKNPKFAVIDQFIAKNGSSVDQLFLNATCPNNSNIAEIKGMETTFPLTLIAGNPENNMILFQHVLR